MQQALLRACYVLALRSPWSVEVPALPAHSLPGGADQLEAVTVMMRKCAPGAGVTWLLEVTLGSWKPGAEKCLLDIMLGLRSQLSSLLAL